MIFSQRGCHEQIEGVLIDEQEEYIAEWVHEKKTPIKCAKDIPHEQ